MITFPKAKDMKNTSDIENILKTIETLRDIPVEINSPNQKFEFVEKIGNLDNEHYNYISLYPIQFNPDFQIGKSRKYQFGINFDMEKSKPVLRICDKKSKKIVCDFYLLAN